MLAVVCPGQGAQVPGMLTDWLELPGVLAEVRRWSELAEVDLVQAGTAADAAAIRDTATAQPLLAAAALLSGRALLGDAAAGVVCGHSIGELPALGLAGVLGADDVLRLAGVRGRAMAAAAASAPTGLSAVLGGDPAEVEAVVTALGLAVATVNVAGQVVVGGPRPALDRLAAAPPAGARVRPLAVAGAFHTAAMAPAQDSFATALVALRPEPASCLVVANADGAVRRDGDELLQRLVGQLTGPVRFDRCLASLARLGVTGVVELAPGGTLGPIVRRALPAAEVVSLRSPADLPVAAALAAAHASAHHAPESPDVPWRLLSAPEGGVVDLLVRQGERADAGQPLAAVSGRAGVVQVPAPAAGRVQEWLVHDGDPVRAGQHLAVLS